MSSLDEREREEKRPHRTELTCSESESEWTDASTSEDETDKALKAILILAEGNATMATTIEKMEDRRSRNSSVHSDKGASGKQRLGDVPKKIEVRKKKRRRVKKRSKNDRPSKQKSKITPAGKKGRNSRSSGASSEKREQKGPKKREISPKAEKIKEAEGSTAENHAVPGSEMGGGRDAACECDKGKRELGVAKRCALCVNVKSGQVGIYSSANAMEKEKEAAGVTTAVAPNSTEDLDSAATTTRLVQGEEVLKKGGESKDEPLSYTGKSVADGAAKMQPLVVRVRRPFVSPLLLTPPAANDSGSVEGTTGAGSMNGAIKENEKKQEPEKEK